MDILGYGEDPWDGPGGDKRTSNGHARPRLCYVRLTAWGHAVADELAKSGDLPDFDPSASMPR